MKNLLLLIITVALFSSNNLAQYNFSTFNNKRSTDNLDKMINAEIKYADNLSIKKSPILNMVLDKILDDNGNYNKTSETINQYRDIMYFYMDVQNILTIPVFIKTSSLEATKGKILELGGIIGTVAGDIVTAHVPASSINFIAESPDVIYIDASTVSETKLDLSRIETKVNQLHNGSGIQRPYKGNGVVVGVLDSGIDWKHQDFKNSGGSRIKYLWDMSGSGNPPSGYNYGTEYTKAQIDATQCQEIDGDDGGGHGTHVSGTAAGNGGANSNYVGMAPESDIIFVKGFRSGPGFSSTDVVNGCNYIFQKSQQLGKPSVINLSLGGHFSPHDGSSLYEQALSNLTGNGKIIVAAAGNEGGSTIHLSYTTAGSSYNDSYETYFELYNNASSVYADMWYSGGNISVGLAAYDNSLNLIGYTNAIAPGQKIENLAFTVSGNTYGYVTIDATGVNNPNNGANEVVVGIDSQNGQVNINNVFWSLYTYGTGTFDAWAVGQGIFSTFAGQTWLKPGDDQKTIGTPGTSNKIICVGSYVTKNQWVDVNGTTQYQPGNPVIGQISNFSSMGPTRDGRLKPDIVAPGEVIVAAYSSFLTQTPVTNIILGGKHQKMQGTSMASPHVTGAVALLLEKNGTLNYDQVVAILKNNAKHDSYTGSSPNNIYGHGKLDAYNSFINTTGGGGGIQTANLIYDDGTPSGGYVWQVNGQGSANRMTPTLNNAVLTKIEIYITGVNTGTATYKPIVLGNSSGTPGSDLANINVKTAVSYPGWDPTDLTSYNIVVNNDFFVGLKYDGVNVPGFGYDPVDNGRAWDFDGTNWSAWNETYFMRATIQTVTSVAEISNEIPNKFELSCNYPNPFNPSTKFKYALPEGRNVKIIIYDINGSKVTELVNNYQGAGTYEVTWNGKNDLGQTVASGTYIYQVNAGDFFQTKKMMLLK